MNDWEKKKLKKDEKMSSFESERKQQLLIPKPTILSDKKNQCTWHIFVL